MKRCSALTKYALYKETFILCNLFSVVASDDMCLSILFSCPYIIFDFMAKKKIIKIMVTFSIFCFL